MNKVIVFLAFISLAACEGETGSTSASQAQQCRPIENVWVQPATGETLPFEAIQEGSNTVTIINKFISGQDCRITFEYTSEDNCSGTMQISDAQFIGAEVEQVNCKDWENRDLSLKTSNQNLEICDGSSCILYGN